MNRCVIQTESCTAAPEEAWLYMSWWCRLCGSKVFPPYQSKPTVGYKQKDPVIMCSDWDHDPSNILESDKVTFFKMKGCFPGGKFTEDSDRRADGPNDLFSSQTLGRLKFFCRWHMLFIGREDRQEDRCFSTYVCGIFFLI